MASSFCAPLVIGFPLLSVGRPRRRVAKCSIQVPEGATVLETNRSASSIAERLDRLQFGFETPAIARPSPDATAAAGGGTVRYRCRNGHVVTSVIGSASCLICPSCVFSECGSSRLCLRKLSATARERGGELLSTVYVNAREKLLWRCARGHVWAASADNVRNQGTWCPYCRRRLGIEHMQRLAATRGGLCLSTEYRGAAKKLRWRCARGHEFEQSYNNAFRKPGGRRKSSWCPHCKDIDRAAQPCTQGGMQL